MSDWKKSKHNYYIHEYVYCKVIKDERERERERERKRERERGGIKLLGNFILSNFNKNTNYKNLCSI